MSSSRESLLPAHEFCLHVLRVYPWNEETKRRCDADHDEALFGTEDLLSLGNGYVLARSVATGYATVTMKPAGRSFRPKRFAIEGAVPEIRVCPFVTIGAA